MDETSETTQSAGTGETTDAAATPGAAGIAPTAPPVGRPRRRRGGVVLAAALVLSAVAASTVASASLSQPTPVPVEQDLQRQIDEMLAAGLPPDHPKVLLLQEQLDLVRAGSSADAPAEPGVDVAAELNAAEAEEAAEDAGAARAVAPAGDAATTAEPAWESGPVECEPVPGLLTAAEVRGAVCVSVPQPDGTSRYIAVGADGTVRSVLFGPDGEVRRLDDSAVGRSVPRGSTAQPTPEGDLVVTPSGDAAVTVDVR